MSDASTADECTTSPIEPFTEDSRGCVRPASNAQTRQSGATDNPFLGEPALPLFPPWERGGETALSNVVLNGLEEKLRKHIHDAATWDRTWSQMLRLRNICQSGDLDLEGVVTGVQDLALTLTHYTGDIVPLEKERSLLCEFFRRDHEMRKWERKSTYVLASFPVRERYEVTDESGRSVRDLGTQSLWLLALKWTAARTFNNSKVEAAAILGLDHWIYKDKSMLTACTQAGKTFVGGVAGALRSLHNSWWGSSREQAQVRSQVSSEVDAHSGRPTAGQSNGEDVHSDDANARHPAGETVVGDGATSGKTSDPAS